MGRHWVLLPHSSLSTPHAPSSRQCSLTRFEALIVAPLRKRFCADRDCDPTEEELRAFSRFMAGADSPESAGDLQRTEGRRMARDCSLLGFTSTDRPFLGSIPPCVSMFRF